MLQLTQLDDHTPILPLKKAYLRSLVFPMDTYWESAVIGQAPHWRIDVDGQEAGYFAVGANKRLLQFFVTAAFSALASDIFTFVVKGDIVQCASAGTFEPAYLSHCLDHQKGVSIRSYLFQDHKRVKPQLDSFPSAQFLLASDAHARQLADFLGQNNEFEDTGAITMTFGSRLNYAKNLIDQGQAFILLDQNELLGVGECRISASQAPYADVGMITSKKHRRQGIGAYMLAELKQSCYDRAVKPICSCAANNVASRKTIEKAGFISQHRLLDIQFAEK